MEEKNTSNIDKYLKAIKAITDEQSKIVGEGMAIELAKTVEGLKFQDGKVQLLGDPVIVLSRLVDKYSILFGKISIEVSKDAVKHMVPDLAGEELPKNLQ